MNELFDQTGHIAEHNCPERWVKLCRKLETQNGRLRSALAQLVDWNCAANEYENPFAQADYQADMRVARDVLSSCKPEVIK